MRTTTCVHILCSSNNKKTVPCRMSYSRLWPQRDQLTGRSDSQGPCLPEQPCFFYTSHISVLRQAALTGNSFLSNLPWQGENISIKRMLPRQTSSVQDNLSAGLCSSLLRPHFISLSAFYTLDFVTPSNSPLLLSSGSIFLLLSNVSKRLSVLSMDV